MNNDDLYNVLNINKGATENEIKKAYRKLVLAYHPDKNKNKDASDKFIKIQSAYEILSNQELKNNYDNTYNNEKINFQNNISDIFNKILTFFTYTNKQNAKKKSQNNLNIIEYVECDLIDRYNDNYMLIEVERKSRDSIKLYIPLKNDTNIFYDEGEIDENNQKGDLILHTKTMNNDGYYCKNGDMYKELKIQKFTDNDNISFQHINKTIINIAPKDIIDDKYIIIPELGLPISKTKRGDLVCEIRSE